MLRWIITENDRGFCLEARSLTHLGVQRELQRSNFVRIPNDPNNLKSYIRYWPNGIQAIARIHPRRGISRVKVTISYYDNKGKKFRKFPTKQITSIGHRDTDRPSLFALPSKLVRSEWPPALTT
jgi:hypothetical protein